MSAEADRQPVALIVEADPEMRDLVADVLQAYGCRVLAAVSPEHAIAVLAARPEVDVALGRASTTPFQICAPGRVAQANDEVGLVATFPSTCTVCRPCLLQERAVRLPQPYGGEQLVEAVRQASLRRAGNA